MAAASAALLGCCGLVAVASEPGPGRVGSPSGTGAQTSSDRTLALWPSSSLGTGVHTGAPLVAAGLACWGAGGTTCQPRGTACWVCAGVALETRFHSTGCVLATPVRGSACSERKTLRALMRGTFRRGLGIEQEPGRDRAALQIELLAQIRELIAGDIS